MAVRFALAGLVLAASSWVAPVESVALTWEVDGCDAAAAMGRAEAVGLTSDAGSGRKARIALVRGDTARVTARVRVEVEDVVVERELSAEGCDLAADAALLVVGAQLRVLEPAETTTAPPPIEAAREPAVPTSPQPASTATPQPAVRTEAEPAAPNPRPRAGDPWLGATGAASFGPLPRTTSRWALALAWQGRILRVQLEAAHLVYRTVSVTEHADVRLMGFGAALRGGVAPQWRTLRFPVLLGAELDDIVGRARGRVSADEIGHAPSLRATLDAGVFWTLHPRVGLELVGGLAVALVRPRFGLRDANGTTIAVPTAQPIGGRVGAGFFFRIG